MSTTEPSTTPRRPLPYKVIHRYRNSAGRTAYHLYVFVGHLPPSLMKTLEQIRTLNLIDALTVIPEEDTARLVEAYGEHWYQSFYNWRHILASLRRLTEDPQLRQVIQSTYGEQWLEDIHRAFQSQTVSYDSLVRRTKERSMLQKLVQSGYQARADEETDYGQREHETIPRFEQQGGEEEDEDLTPEVDDPELDEEPDFDDAIATLEANSKTVSETIREIKSQTGHRRDAPLPWPSTEDRYTDVILENVWEKLYVTRQRIYEDDSITRVRDKICAGFLNDPAFADPCYLIPGYQHLWTEYLHGDQVRAVTVGYKWINRNSLLKMDYVPPQDLSQFMHLTGKLEGLADLLRRGARVRMDNDSALLVHDYMPYMLFRELYLVDLYHELGNGFNPTPTEAKSLGDVYLRLYFPYVSASEYRTVLGFLQGGTEASVIEKRKLQLIYRTCDRDLLLENEVTDTVQDVQLEDYTAFTDPNHLTQAAIRSYVLPGYQKLDLFRVFDNFRLSETYPYIHYLSNSGPSRSKIHSPTAAESGAKLYAKWLEGSSYGINLKIRVDRETAGHVKYMTVNIIETGRLDYKIQWRENEGATLESALESRQYVYSLIDKINQENEEYGIRLYRPKREGFSYSFINSIMRFHLPSGAKIDHNCMSDFCRYLYPYVSLVIEPRKNYVAKGEERSGGKYGSYLDYKRISGYDITQTIEARIVYYLKNYEHNETALTGILAKEFNITEGQAFDSIVAVRTRYPRLRHTRKVLRRLDEPINYRTPGINLSIQGKNRENYKFRVSGAKNAFQMRQIVTFLQCLLYLYIQVYVYRKPRYTKILDRLESLTHIARRLTMVYDLVDTDPGGKTVRQMALVDADRLRYSTEGGVDGWSRRCQNSGDDKRRRPRQYLSTEQLEEEGYVWQEGWEGIPYGHWAKEYTVDGQVVTSRAVALPITPGGDDYVYYACNPDENGRHMHTGFLSNPNGLPLPCCFIIDPLTGNNTRKRQQYLRNAGAGHLIPEAPARSSAESLYILQESKRVPAGRLAFLPQSLDILLNTIPGHQITLENHTLRRTEGYYLKYGPPGEDRHYLHAVAAATETSVEEIIERACAVLEEDEGPIYTSLDSGRLRLAYGPVEEFIHYLRHSQDPPPEVWTGLLAIPGVVTEDGVRMIVYRRHTETVYHELERDETRRVYSLECMESEDLDVYQDPVDIVICLWEHQRFYPVFQVEYEGELRMTRTYRYQDRPDNPIELLSGTIRSSCQSSLRQMVNDASLSSRTAREMVRYWRDQGQQITGQQVDRRCLVRYVYLNRVPLPVIPSGALPDLPLQEGTATYRATLRLLDQLQLPIRGTVYDRVEGARHHVVGVALLDGGVVPVTPLTLSESKVRGELIYSSLDAQVDDQIVAAEEGVPPDDRVRSVAEQDYREESYAHYRLHLCYYLAYTELGRATREQILALLQERGDKPARRRQIRQLLYRLSDRTLARRYAKISGGAETDRQYGMEDHHYLEDLGEEAPTVVAASQRPGLLDDHPDQWMVTGPVPDYTGYQVSNLRRLCYLNQDADSCGSNIHCTWTPEDWCTYCVPRELLVSWVNKATEELLQDGIRAAELLSRDGYTVPDIVSYHVLSEAPDERVVMLSNVKISQVLSELFGQEYLQRAGRRVRSYLTGVDYGELNATHPPVIYSRWLMQGIWTQDNTIFRAFANALYWQRHPDYPTAQRNLGYYSKIQTDLAHIYRSQTVAWLRQADREQWAPWSEYLGGVTLEEYLTELDRDGRGPGPGLLELGVLATVNRVQIHLYNDAYQLDHLITATGIRPPPRTIPPLDADTLAIRLSSPSSRGAPESAQAMYDLPSTE